MLYLLLILLKNRVDKKLSLKELFLFNRAIEESLKRQIPKEVLLKLFAKEMVLKILGKVVHYLLKGILMLLMKISECSMEKREISVVDVKELIEYL